MKVFCVLLLGVAAVIAAPKIDTNVELPSSLKICKLNDPKRDECIKDSIQTFLPETHNSFPNINLSSMDPFNYESGKYEYKQTARIQGSISVKNTKLYGLSRAQVRGVKSNITDKIMDLDIDIFWPRVFCEGLYKGEALFNEIRFASKGTFNLTMKNVVTTLKLKGSVVSVDGEDYMKMSSFDSVPTVGEMKVSATGLFPDPQLNQVAIDFVNQYWPIMYEEMLPETRKAWEPIVLGILNKFFLTVPYKRLLLKD
ncbi:unnamed protein product [Diamesa serratosioi]